MEIRPLTAIACAPVSFNSATALLPWKSHCGRAGQCRLVASIRPRLYYRGNAKQASSHDDLARLQFGHGFITVEIWRARTTRSRVGGFNSATALLPWKYLVPDNNSIANGRFNSATALLPWKWQHARSAPAGAARGFNSATALLPWKFYPTGTFRTILTGPASIRPRLYYRGNPRLRPGFTQPKGKLQFGHGFITVEISRRPRRNSHRNPLQFGHGFITVEITAWLPVVGSVGGGLQFGHGFITVEIQHSECEGTRRRASIRPRLYYRGNDVTVRRRWYRVPASIRPRLYYRGNVPFNPCGRGVDYCFNSATALLPWKSRSN